MSSPRCSGPLDGVRTRCDAQSVVLLTQCVFYAILRSIPNRLGVVAAIALVFVALSALPFINTSQVRSSNLRLIYKGELLWLSVYYLSLDCSTTSRRSKRMHTGPRGRAQDSGRREPRDMGAGSEQHGGRVAHGTGLRRPLRGVAPVQVRRVAHQASPVS